MKRIYLIVLLLLIIAGNMQGQETTLHPIAPYPIIFVHGLTDSDNCFANFAAQLLLLQNKGGTLSDLKTLDFCLNHDGSDITSNADDDVELIGWRYGSAFSEYGLYAINFDTKRLTLSDHTTATLSNQAAIYKQGMALSKMIKMVLEMTQAKKVILIGHSMGGLAIREYLQRTDENGKHIWWADPNDEFAGHHVAKIGTIATPHGGSNVPINLLTELYALWWQGKDLNSEAVRDLNSESVYLNGGYEYDFLRLSNLDYYHHDINCDGRFQHNADLITGLNSYNFPYNLAYSCIIGIGDGFGANGNPAQEGDGIVSEFSANLFNFNRNEFSVDTFLMKKPDEFEGVWHSGMLTKFSGLIRILDEPQTSDLAYEIGANSKNNGFITYRTDYNPQDLDVYKINLTEDGLITISVEASEHTGITSISLVSGGLISSPEGSIDNISGIIEFQAKKGIHYISVSGYATDGDNASYKYPYILQTRFEKAPDIKTSTVYYNIGETSAVCGGNIISNIGPTITASGLVYSKTPAPTLATGTVVSTSPVVGSGPYSLTINGLEPDTKYFVRAYATNSTGTWYGEEKNFTTFANSPYTLTDADVVVTNGVIQSCSYDFAKKIITIPETLDGQTVVGIAENSPGVFEEKGIAKINLPNTLNSIVSYAFYNNQLTSVTIPNGVTTIGWGAFSNNQLTSVTIPNSVTSIVNAAFSGNQLTSVTIPANVTSIGIGAFSGNTELASFTLPVAVSAGNTFLNWKDNYGTTYAGSAVVTNFALSYTAQFENTPQPLQYTLTDDDVVVTNGRIESCSYNFAIKDIIIPETLDGQKVVALGWALFSNKPIAKITIPNSITQIGQYAFAENSSFSITLPIPVFGGGRKFVNWIDSNGYTYAGGTNVTDFSVAYNALIEYTLTDGDVVVTDGVIQSCSYNFAASSYNFTANSIIIPEKLDEQTVVGIANEVFQKKGIYYVQLPKTLKTIGSSTFYHNYLISLIIPNGVTTIGNGAFYNNNLTSISIPNSVTSIAWTAFGYNHLSYITLPAVAISGLTFINWIDSDGNTYAGGANVTDFWMDYTAQCDYTLTDADVVVTNGIIQSCSYNLAANHITIPEILDGQTVVGIANRVFESKEIIEINLPKTLNTIGELAFFGNQLTSVTIPNSVITIGEYAFFCNQLTSVTIPNSVTSIGKYSFYGNQLTSVSLPNSVTTIDAFAFSSNSGLASITLPEAELQGIRSNNWKNGNGIIIANNTTVTDFSNSYTAQFVYPTYTITGTVTGTDGVTVALSGDVTDSKTVNDGEVYSFTVNYRQNVEVTATKTGYLLTPVKYSLASIDADKTGNNFAATVEAANGLKISVNTANIAASAGSTATVNVEANVTWSASSDQSWLTVSPGSGSGNQTLTFTVDANPSATIRTATVTISATGVESQTIIITQTGANIPLAVTAGGLKAIFTAEELASITKLTLTGTIDARDFKTMRDDMPLLAEIDLSGATIVAYSGTEGTDGINPTSIYEANTVPFSAFMKDWQGKKNLNSIVLPNSLTKIDWSAFRDCDGLKTVIIPMTVVEIDGYVFMDCDGLTSIEIPALVTSIGGGVFWNCINLSSIKVYNATPVDFAITQSSNVFDQVNKITCTLIVPFGSKVAYQSAPQWKDFTNLVEMPGFKLSANTATLDAASGSNATVDIAANVEWAATSDQSWLTVSPGSGNGNQTLSFTAEANPSATTRTATVTVSATGVDSQTITITQDASSIVTQSIVLNAGWNIISVNIAPANLEMKTIFQPLIDAGKLKKVMDETGKTLENLGAFGGWKNNIGNLNSAKGYKVNVTAAASLSLEGFPVQLPYDMALNAGWNIISFPSASIQDAKAIVQPLIDAGKLKKVMDEAGKTIENLGAFGGWRNTIGNFIPGKGYKINVTASCTLSIPSSGNKSAVVIPELLASEHFKPVFTGNGTDHMNIHLINLQNTGIQVGDEIGIFDGELCVGSAIVGAEQLRDGSVNIPASCDDGLSAVSDGFAAGHPVRLKLFQNIKEYTLKMEPVQNSQNVFAKGESIIVQVGFDQATGLDELANEPTVKCYPNPFSDQINIEIVLQEPQKLDVRIYDVNGKLVRNLYKTKNEKRIKLVWDGNNDNGSKMVPGSYFLKANNTVEKILFRP